MAIELKLSRSNRVYRPMDDLLGTLVVDTPSAISHYGIRLTVNASVNLQLGSGTIGVIESLYSSLKPFPIIKKVLDIRSAGKLNAGKTEIPFNTSLTSNEKGESYKFYETYHGSNISIQYLLTADVIRGYLYKPLTTTLEFIIESGNGKLYKAPVCPESVNFYITHDTQKHQLLPELRSGGFRVTGKVATQCSLTDPVIGDLTVEESAVPIHSIDIILLRSESIIVGDKTAVQTSKCQVTQVADGDVCRGMPLPIHVTLPRLLTCPELATGSFSIEFQLQVTITFASNLSKLYSQSDLIAARQWVASQILPLRLVRADTVQKT